MILDRLRHSPLLVLFPPVFLLVCAMANAFLSGPEMMHTAWWFGVLSLCTAILLGTVSGSIAIIVFYLALVYALITVLPTVFQVGFGISTFGSVILALALIIAIGFAVVRLRSPFQHQFTGEIFIERPRAEVWDALYLQPTENHWKPHVRKIEAAPDRADHFIEFYQGAADQPEEEAAPPMMILRSNVTKGSSFTVETVENPDQQEGKSATDRQTFVLEDSGDGTRVTTVEVLENVWLHILVLCVLINPCQDALRQLKSILEGSNDTTFASGFYKDDK